MPYIIDGHNLIPKVPGLTLNAVNDEMQLVEMLQVFCRRQRKQVEVYFDNAPVGGVRARSFGSVTAYFVRQGMTADESIRRRLARLGRAARNWTVVSSDRAVQDASRSARAHILSSEEFVRRLIQTSESSEVDLGEDPDAAVDPGELDNWLQLFNSGEGESKDL